jgi:exopolysaccharide biosynthesis polyprenyl glycosylphosphotransferase
MANDPQLSATVAPTVAPGVATGTGLAHPSTHPAGLPASWRQDRLRRRLLAIGDIFAVLVALVVSTALTPGPQFVRGLLWGALLLPGWLVLFKTYGLYERDGKRISHTTVDDIPSLFHAVLLGNVLTWLWFQIGPTGKLPFLTVLTFGVTAMLLILTARALARTATRRLLPHERVLIIGEGALSDSLYRKMRAHPEYGLDPVGVARAGINELVNPADLRSLVQMHRIERILLAATPNENEELLPVLSACRQLQLKVSVVPNVFEAMGPATELDELEGIPVLGVSPAFLPPSSRLIKRTMDIAVASILLLFSAPLLLLIAIAIKLDSRGPVLFTQRRIGKGGVQFQILKFRTMIDGAERLREQLIGLSTDPHWMMLERDPRITRVGSLLRKTSLDELPQLWNVIRGQMSLVGPRPLPEPEDRLIEGWGRGRLDLTPGITGYWQVLGRNSIPFTEMVKLDYIYVTNWSLWSDVRLILRTIPVVLSRRGVN